MAQWSMRTTIDIPDAIYRQLKSRAVVEGRPVKALILDGVEQILAPASKLAKARIKVPRILSKRPGTLQLDNARIYDVISFP